jgi:glycine betaine/choline ABC-type transport system substrate-binding protein
MRPTAALVALLAVLVLAPAVAGAQGAAVRLAAPPDCLTNPTCGVGLRSVYGLRVDDAFVKLAVADSGVGALDDGIAEVAVAFTSSPSVSRPDVLSLRDDRDMLKPDHVVPVVSSRLLRSSGRAAARDIRARLNAASALISTRVLRALNQQVADGRLPEAVGGEFVDANGLGGDRARRSGPRIVVGYQDFPENETLAHLYAEALHAGGYRVRVRAVGDLRAGAIRALRTGRISVYPDYARSLLGYLRGRPERRSAIGAALRGALARIGAEPQRFAPGQNRNVFVMKRDAAARLGVAKLSDLGRFWPAAVS